MNDSSAPAVTYADLADINGTALVPDGAGENTELTVADAVRALLLWTGMTEQQLGSFPDDYLAQARSMGMIDADTDADAPCTLAAYRQMKAVADQMYDALHADKLQPLYMNGMAQPIFPYTTGEVTEGYSNDESDIIRYCVYVETNYDTDDDGKLDLVKALVQIPRAAMEGNYKAATIYEARPYITGCNESMNPGENLGSEGYDISKLYSQPDKRVPAGTATTAEAAANANSADWYYWNPSEWMYDYEDLNWYDYYLVRGFAVVECGGLGTKGSDGFETCGTDLEIDAFKCVIEWLHGDRVAYTDKTSNVAISADWSSGKVGMTGRSYAGTTQFGLGNDRASPALRPSSPSPASQAGMSTPTLRASPPTASSTTPSGSAGTATAATSIRTTTPPSPKSTATTCTRSSRISSRATATTPSTGRPATTRLTRKTSSARR